MNLRKIKARLRGNELGFYAGAGVFSSSRVDRGTEILVDYSILKDGQRILDLGCGYGAVGLSVAKAFPNAEIVMTDVNARAVSLARMNAEMLKLKNVHVVQGDLFVNVTGKFDVILLNPPQSAGRELCYAMMGGAHERLSKGGSLQLIARNKKGGEMLGKRMMDIFGNLRIIVKKSGYWLYCSEL